MRRSGFALFLCVLTSVTAGLSDELKTPQHRNHGQSASGLFNREAWSRQYASPDSFLIFNPSVPDNWLGGAGNWSVATDWSAGVPGTTSDVTIYSGGNDLVTLDVSSTINSLTLGGASNGTTSGITDIGLPQTLTIANAMNVGTTGYISFVGGSTISAGAASSNAGQIDLENNSTLKITGDLSNTGRLGTNFMLFGGGNTINITGMLTNSGNFGLNGPGDLATIGTGVSNSGTLDAENGSTLNITGDVTNTGTLATDMNGRGGSNTLSITGNFTNMNSFTLGGPMDTLTTTGTLTNQLLFSVSGTGSMATVRSLVNSATLTVENGSTLQVNGTTTNSGNLVTGFFGTGGNTLNITGSLTNTGPIEFLGPNDTGSFGSLSNNSGVVDLENGSTLTINGNVTNTAGAGLGTGLFHIMGTGGNTLNITGTVTNDGGFRFFGPGDQSTVGGLSNSGLVDVENGSSLTIHGAVPNSGTIETDMQGFGGGNTVTITGLLTDSNASSQFTLNGAGDMGTIGGLVNAGQVAVDAGSTLQINGAANNSGTLITGIGSVNDTLNVAGGLTNSGFVFITGNGDTATIGGNVSNTHLIAVEGGATLTINGAFDNSGFFETSFNGGGNAKVTVNNLLTNAAGAQMFLYGPGDMLQALGGLSNSGTINVNRGSTIDPPFLNNLGTLNVAANSTIVVGTGSPMGTGYIQLPNGTLGEMISSTNFGVIDVTGPASLDGTLDILLQGGFNPAVGSMYQFLLFTPGQLNGVFANIQNDIFNNGTEMWLVNYDNPGGFVELTAETHTTPEPATLLLMVPGVLGVAYRLRRKRDRALQA